MSNEYKEWYKDCKDQAWSDIGKIAEVAETYNRANTEEIYLKIEEILKEGGWL